MNEIGRGALEASVETCVRPSESVDAVSKRELFETTDETSVDGLADCVTESAMADRPGDAKLGLGDLVTVKLVALEFSGLTGFAQMLVAAKAPKSVKPIIEGTPVFDKVGAGLDLAYGLLRGGLTFSSQVTEWNSDSEALTYVDEGVKLPKPLVSWTHTHRITENDEGGMIVDELTVEVDPAIAAPVVESALRLHLDSRAKAYKKILEV